MRATLASFEPVVPALGAGRTPVAAPCAHGARDIRDGTGAGCLYLTADQCGPDGLGNGGLVAGMLAEHLGGEAQVVLHRPVPVERRLAVGMPEPGRVELSGDALLATALRLRSGAAASAFPPSLRLDRCRPMAALCAEHPFPRCMVCGPERSDARALRILPLEWRPGVVAAPWAVPGIACADGLVCAPYLWAALDCPGAWAIASLQGPGRMVLGQFTVRIVRRPTAGEALLIVGRARGACGRRRYAETAIYDSARDVVAWGAATWVMLEDCSDGLAGVPAAGDHA